MGETEAGEWGVGSDVGKAGLRNWDGGKWGQERRGSEGWGQVWGN